MHRLASLLSAVTTMANAPSYTGSSSKSVVRRSNRFLRLNSLLDCWLLCCITELLIELVIPLVLPEGNKLFQPILGSSLRITVDQPETIKLCLSSN